MNIVPLSNATRVMGKDQPEFQPLPICDTVLENGQPCMLSMWMPTSEELALLNAGYAVTLGILGVSHPPVLLFVQGSEDDTNVKEAD